MRVITPQLVRGGRNRRFFATEKLVARFPRTLRNLARAVREVPHVLVYDNSERAHPFRAVAVLEQGAPVTVNEPVPAWARGLLEGP